jgi:hypothetical protein
MCMGFLAQIFCGPGNDQVIFFIVTPPPHTYTYTYTHTYTHTHGAGSDY